MMTQEEFLTRYHDWSTADEAAARAALAAVRTELSPGVRVVAVRARGRFALMLRRAAELMARTVPDVTILTEADAAAPAPAPAAPGFTLEAVFGGATVRPEQAGALVAFMLEYREYLTTSLDEARAKREAVGGSVGGQRIVILQVGGTFYTLMPEGPAQVGVGYGRGTVRIVPDDEAPPPPGPALAPPALPAFAPATPLPTFHPILSGQLALGEDIPTRGEPPSDDEAEAFFRDDLFAELNSVARKCKERGLPFLFAVQLAGMQAGSLQETNGVLALQTPWQSQRMTVLQGVADGKIPLPAGFLHVPPPDRKPQD